jgi:crossover junction endodeoxyribonuclease RusA
VDPPAPLPLPFEFTVQGTPVSHQSANRQLLGSWRQQVRAAATARWGANSPLGVPLRITVVYYHDGPAARIDADNMLKPILDALIDLVYDDDTRITDAAVRKTPASGPIVALGQSIVLLEAFAAGQEFVHIRIDRAPDHSTPLG